MIAGIVFEDMQGFQGETDGDVVLQALCNAITSLTHIPILTEVAEELCLKEGITDSEVYLQAALTTLDKQRIQHIAISLEAKRPLFQEYFLDMREKIASICSLEKEQVGITAMSGDGLSDVSCGDGVSCLALITTVEE